MLPGWCCIANRHIGARERRQLIPHVHFQVPFLGSESQLKSGFACADLFCSFRTALAGKSFALHGNETSASTIVTDTIRKIDFEMARLGILSCLEHCQVELILQGCM